MFVLFLKDVKSQCLNWWSIKINTLIPISSELSFSHNNDNGAPRNFHHFTEIESRLFVWRTTTHFISNLFGFWIMGNSSSIFLWCCCFLNNFIVHSMMICILNAKFKKKGNLELYSDNIKFIKLEIWVKSKIDQETGTNLIGCLLVIW